MKYKLPDQQLYFHCRGVECNNLLPWPQMKNRTYCSQSCARHTLYLKTREWYESKRKLTEQEAIEILSYAPCDYKTKVELAHKYKVSPSCIYNIHKGDTWAYLQKKEIKEAEKQ